jgi:hypothetical protein
MKEYENVFVDSQLRLCLSVTMFERSCRELLQDLPDKQIHDLVNLRKGWDDPDLMEKLRRRLGKDFEIYRLSVTQLNKRIEILRQKLKLREDLTVRYPSAEITLSC